MTESDLAAIEARAKADLDEEITSAIGKERNEVVRLIRCSRTMRRRYDERTADVRALAAEVRRLRAVADATEKRHNAEDELLRDVVDLARERHEECEQSVNHRKNPNWSGPCLLCEALAALDGTPPAQD